MPTYYARGVSIRLGAQPLADTITPKIVLKKGENAKTQCEDAERNLLRSKLLTEKCVHFPGDKAGFELNWLGGAPFMQVRAGDDLFDEDRDENHVNTVRPRRHSPHDHGYSSGARCGDDSLALSLHVKLTEKTFTSGLHPPEKLHLKIDVFFNGQLSNCLFMPFHDVRSGTKAYHQVFAGCRVDFLAERPWVILSTQKDAERSHDISARTVSTEQRWREICQALAREANERGMDRDGKIPPSAEYFQALAAMRMPAEVKCLQRLDGKAFGVVDVVITAGYGRKVTSGTAYLKAPQRLSDENYPLQLTEQAKEEPAILERNKAQHSQVERDDWTTSNATDVDAAGESDSDYEPPTKRQALARHILSLPSSPKIVLPDKNDSARILPISALHTPGHLSSVPSLSERKSQTSEPLSSAERSRAHQQDSSAYSRWPMFSDATYGTPQSFYSFSNSSVGLAHTPQMHPSPYIFQYSDSMLGQDSPSVPMRLASFGNTGFQSSPLQQLPRSMHGAPLQDFPPQKIRAEDPNDIRGLTTGASASSLPESLRSASMHSSLTSKSAAADGWDEHVLGDGMRPPASSQSAGYVPNMLPVSRSSGPFAHLPIGGLPFPFPYDRRNSMPLPPTGMFSVPTKPRSSKSPSKRSRRRSPEKKMSGFSLKRLIITGRDGAVVVDHKWTTTRHVAAKRSNSYASCTPEASPVSNPVGSLDSTNQSAPVVMQRASRSAEASVKSMPIAFANATKQTSTIETGKVVKSLDNEDLVSPPLQAHEGKHIANSNNIVGHKANMSAKLGTSAPHSATRSAIPQRRVPSNNDILGVQGPKATTFWLEDPEEVLREAARLRRSRTSIKRKQKSAPTLESVTLVQVRSAPEDLATASSSPLSTVPSSPEPVNGLDVDIEHNAPLVSTPATPNVSTSAIPQFDGSSVRRDVSSSPTKKLAAGSIPRFHPRVPSTPKPSPSPNTKKRKAVVASGRNMPKMPRSPDRLKTMDNPPLNQNCVIAFAESKDEDGENGVLRQVRGERQGVFAEEYVVLATRFFVAGI
ncbi:hypothetical protein CC86DRAFT_116487 [Ophiobolus disseminans]|uniref:Uncharacterized protein n=1 Tax=Ophiobolus disseminans TaxID=1469910 RepID=A0A6A6ZHW4_9PLEO|nr:hypothetical protein CC86DRAFT_116487 [Ophiobolus disseminans]